MASFPSSLDSFIGFTASHTLATDQHASQHNLEQSAIVAVETKLGTGSSTPTSGLPLVGTGTGTSAWGAVSLTGAGVSGILPIANGGTGSSTATGSGNTVLATSPTISGANLTSQPTISDFTNANHGHTNTAGGGTLNAANALQAGSVNYANLLSSIFSGQVISYSNGGSGGGTFYYINLGGVKLLWGLTATQSFNTGYNAAIINMPASFFSTITFAIGNLAGTASGQNNVGVAMQAITPSTSVTAETYAPSGSQSSQIAVLLIGT